MKLVEASNTHFQEIMTWFGGEASLKIWGGPSFRYPFNEESFLQDLKLGAMRSYALVENSVETIAFGQIYLKLGRGHLARLVVSPEHRRHGYGAELIDKLMKRAAMLYSCSEYSLYVMRGNAAARSCYKKIGFKDSVSPDNNVPRSDLQFMVRKSW